MFLIILCVCLLLQSSSCSNKTFNIFGFFEEPYQEEAARYAINKVNSRTDTNFKLNLLTAKTLPDDAFWALNITCENLKAGIVGVLGPTSPSSIDIVQSICDVKEIPHILTRWYEFQEIGTQINFYPNVELMMDAYIDIINYMGWDEVTILYVNYEVLPQLGYFIEKGSRTGITVYIEQLRGSDNADYRSILRKLRDSGRRNFMVHCQAELLKDVLLEIQRVGMLVKGYSYLLSNSNADIYNLEEFSQSEAYVIGVQLVNENNYYEKHKRAVIPNTESALIIDAIDMLANALKFVNANQDVNISCKNLESWKYGQSVVNVLKSDDSYVGLTGQVKFSSNGIRNSFEMNIFELKYSGLKPKNFYWNTTHGLVELWEVEEEETGTENRNLVVITALTEPYAMLKATANELSGNDRYEGFVIDIIHELSKMNGFNYTIVIRPDKQVGIYESHTKSWSGMIGDIIKGYADIAIGDVTITAERNEVVDFTPPFMTLGISILYKKALKQSTQLLPFIDRFSWYLWKSVLVAGFLVSVVLFLLGRVSSSEWKKSSPLNPEFLETDLTFTNCLWFITGSIMRQSYDIKLRSVATRIVAAAWWFFTLFMISFYVVNLIFILSNEIPNPDQNVDFKNFEELVRRAPEKNIIYGAKRHGATEQYFRMKARDQPGSAFAIAWENMQHQEEAMVNTNIEGVERAVNERYAFFMESSSIEYEVERNCVLQQVDGLLDSKGYGIAVRKDSPYLHSLSTGILKLQNLGAIAELRRKWWTERRGGRQCITYEIDEVPPLNLANMSGIFWIVIIGVSISLFVSIVETIVYTTRKAVKAKIPLAAAFRQEFRSIFSLHKRVKPVIKPGSRPKSSSRTKAEGEADTVL